MYNPSETKMRVVIAEDHALIRIGLRILLEQRGVEVIGEAESGEAAVKLTADSKPDIVLMDLSMPQMDGIEAARRIREFDSDVKIIMLTSNDNEHHIFASLSAGANGYCLKETHPDRLMTALETVRAGDLWLDSNIAAKVLRGLPSRREDTSKATGDRPQDPAKLTTQELEVLHLIVEGLHIADISTKLSLCELEVKTLEFSIMEKLAGSERTQSALRSLRTGDEDSELSTAKSCEKCGREFNEGFVCCPFDGTQLELVCTDQLTGKVFADKYEVLARLGNGGMSVVYKARHKLLGRTVAIKLLDPLLCPDLQNAKRFREEALASSLLNHPNVINIFDFGLTPGGEPYLVMDYLSGNSLGELIRQCGYLSAEEGVSVFLQICDGLSHAHGQGVVHRDLKPSNIMIMPNDNHTFTVKIIDFGIAKVLSNPKMRSQNLTVAGEILGSPTYMSPEQCSGLTLDERSDIYSFGCLMFEALTGAVPFLGAVALATMHMHLDCQPDAPSTRVPGIPPSLDQIVLKAMQKDPIDRYQTIMELKNALVELANSGLVSEVESTDDTDSRLLRAGAPCLSDGQATSSN